MLNFLADKDEDESLENNSSQDNFTNLESKSSHGQSSSPSDIAANSLLGRFIKRQRVNSAANKHEFSFIPKFTKATSTKKAESNTRLSPILKPSKAPFDTSFNRKRDLKDTLKKQMTSEGDHRPNFRPNLAGVPLPKVNVNLQGLDEINNGFTKPCRENDNEIKAPGNV